MSKKFVKNAVKNSVQCSYKNMRAVIAFFLLAIPFTGALGVEQTQHAEISGAHHASASRLQLRWELQRNEFNALHPEGHSLVHLSITNLDSESIPAQGWGIYFNCIDGVELGPLDGGLAMEQVSGSWFRLVPTAGFKGIAAGQTLTVAYAHPEVVAKLAMAPTGPYLVYVDAPEKGEAISNYQVMPLIDKSEKDPVPLITPLAIFQRNAQIDDIPLSELQPIFPTPRLLQRRAGILHLATLPKVSASSTLQVEAAFAKTLLQPYFSTEKNKTSAPTLRLEIGAIAGQTSDQAYELRIDASHGITIKGNSAAGVFYGLQSLRDLLPLQAQTTDGVDLPAVFVSDTPRFAYRGFLLDVARNFHTKTTIFKLLDLMARYKLNKFHFHLADDEGWRLEIAGLPELTTFGGRRGHTLLNDEHLQPAYGSGPDINDPHGSGYYSRTDYIDILKYAAARHIEVIPEIDMPGHARAAVKSMEARTRRMEKAGQADARRFMLNDPNDRSVFKSAQLYSDNIIDPGLESSYFFIEHVVAEIAKLHKEAGVALHTIHVGGDELASGAWEKSPASLALMLRLNMTSGADLWDYFYDRVDHILHKHGLFASGWEEMGERKVMQNDKALPIPNILFSKRNFNILVWTNEDANQRACHLANAGYHTILAPASHLYFDMAVNKNPTEPGVNWGAYIDLDTVYDFNPFDCLGDAKLSAVGRKNIRGIEGTLFTETVRDPERIDTMIMPRLLGLAERAWAASPSWVNESNEAKSVALHRDTWSQFSNQVGKRVLPRLDAEKLNLQYRIAPPGLHVVDGQVHANHQLPGFDLRYTTDGSEPNVRSALVTGTIAAKGLIYVAAFNRNGRQSRSSVIDNP